MGDGADGRGLAGSDREGEEAVWAGWAGWAAQERKKGGREEWAGLEGEKEKWRRKFFSFYFNTNII